MRPQQIIQQLQPSGRRMSPRRPREILNDLVQSWPVRVEQLLDLSVCPLCKRLADKCGRSELAATSGQAQMPFLLNRIDELVQRSSTSFMMRGPRLRR